MEKLNLKTVKELRDLAKELNITGRWEMNKGELVNAIKAAQHSDSEITFETDCIVKDDDQSPKKTPQEYLKTIKPGTLVAFKRKHNKDIAMSGKYTGVDAKGKLIIESKKGTIYTVDPENIVWVKTGVRWPKWVFAMFNTSDKKEGDQ